MKKSKADIICDKFHKKHENSKEYRKDSDLSITLTRLEEEEMRLWMKEHEKTCPIRKKQLKSMKEGHYPVSGWCSYHIIATGTSLGWLLEIKCDCGKKRDITHVESW